MLGQALFILRMDESPDPWPQLLTLTTVTHKRADGPASLSGNSSQKCSAQNCSQGRPPSLCVVSHFIKHFHIHYLIDFQQPPVM